jgi:hypothetical protein
MPPAATAFPDDCLGKHDAGHVARLRRPPRASSAPSMFSNLSRALGDGDAAPGDAGGANHTRKVGNVSGCRLGAVQERQCPREPPAPVAEPAPSAATLSPRSSLTATLAMTMRLEVYRVHASGGGWRQDDGGGPPHETGAG